MNTAIQLDTLRDVDETPNELLSRVAETSFDGVEFAGAPDAATVDAFDWTGLDAEACADAGAERLVYEHDGPSDPLTSIPHGAAALDDLR